MKRILLLVGALFLLASCTTEFDQLLNGSRSDKARQTTVFQASTEVATAPETKVYADEDMKVLWNADDRISIFNLTTYNYQFAFTGDDGDTAGGFELIPDSGFITGTNVDYVYAAYPYSKTNKLSNQGVFTMVLPAEQSYKEHSFGIGANTMVAVTEDNFLAFKNVGGYLSLRLYGDDVKVSRITIKGNNGEKIAGKASIEMPLGGVPTVTMDNSATDEISVVCNPAVKIGENANSYTDFWFVIPPVTFEKGFTITVTDDKGGVFEKSTSKSFTVSRNTLDWMNPLKVVILSEEQPNNEIWYTSTNGEIVEPKYSESFNAEIVSNTYENGKGIIRFSEDLTTIGGAAFWGANFKTIQLPNSLTSIIHQAFGGCRYLETIHIPESVTSIGTRCFVGCDKLASFTGKFASADQRALIIDGKMVAFAPAGLTEYTVDNSVVLLSGFEACRKIKTVVLPSGLKQLDSDAFADCSGLERITLPSSLETIGYFAFNGCTSLTTLRIPESVTSFGLFCFDRCSSLSSFTGKYASTDGRFLMNNNEIIAIALGECNQLIIPEGITTTCTIRDNNALQEIVFPSTITQLGQVFRCKGVESIIVKAKTPPTIISHSFHDDNSPTLFEGTDKATFYVPAESVDAYKTAQYWSDYADRIVPLLSSGETANCYIVNDAGLYSFDASVIGNGNKGILPDNQFHVSDAFILPKAVKLVWQDNNIVSNLQLKNNMVLFEASSEKGNALIAVTDGADNILWSWHIWATDQPQTYSGPSSFLIMDRNLGATSPNKQDGEKTFGLFYQWGRKDPFRGNDYKLTQKGSDTGSVSYTVSHPDEFIAGEAYWTDAELLDPWGFSSQTKTIYDPCPPGYKVMNSDSFSPSNTNYDNVYKGRSYGTLWFPFAGRLGYGFSEPDETGWGLIGEMALYFVNSNASYSCCFDLVFTEYSVMTQNLQYKAFGESVRCQLE